MIMRLMKKNMLFLQNNCPGVFEEIKHNKPMLSLKIEPLADQVNFFIEHGDTRCFLHSVYNVQAEMESMFKNVDREVEVLILYGFGCGHAFKFIKENFAKIETVVVVEPCLELFKLVVSFVDLEELFSGIANVVLVLNKNREECKRYLEYIVQENLSRRIGLAGHLSYFSLFGDYIANLNWDMLSYIQNLRTNVATEVIFRIKWLRNQISNVMIKDKVYLEDVMNSFKGLDAIIVSAGPSLEKNMHLLTQVKDRALVVAVGTGIKILDSHGIVPHLRMAVDGSDTERRIFENIDTASVPLIYANSLNSKILSEYKGPKIEIVLNAEYLVQYLYEKLGIERVQFESGFSVAVIAAEVLCRAGCRRLIFLGQDLCYSQNRLYAPGSWKESNCVRDFSDPNFIKTTDIFGNSVYTTRSFLGMKGQLEKKTIQYPGVEFINATEGGLRIEGMQLMSFDKVLKTLDGSTKTKQRIRDIARCSFPTASVSQQLERVLNEIYAKASEIVALNEHRLNRLTEIESIQDEHVKDSQLNGLSFYDWKLQQNDFFKAVVVNELKAYLMAVNHAIRSRVGELEESELLGRLHGLRGKLFLEYAHAVENELKSLLGSELSIS